MALTAVHDLAVGDPSRHPERDEGSERDADDQAGGQRNPAHGIRDGRRRGGNPRDQRDQDRKRAEQPPDEVGCRRARGGADPVLVEEVP
jgi:hypothetical protein